MGLKRGRGRTSSPTQSRSSLLVKKGVGRVSLITRFGLQREGEMRGVAWHIGVRGANKGGILSDTPPPPLLDVWGKEGFFPPSLSLLAGFWWYEPQSRSMGPTYIETHRKTSKSTCIYLLCSYLGVFRRFYPGSLEI